MKTENINNIHADISAQTAVNPAETPGAPPPESTPDSESQAAGAQSSTRRRVPGFIKKPRADSPLWRLPEDIQAELMDFMESRTLAETARFMAEKGVQTSVSALCRFRAGWIMRLDRMEDESATDLLATEPDENRAEVNNEELFELGQRRLMTRAIRLGDDKAWARLHRLRQHEQWLALQARRVKALEARTGSGPVSESPDRASPTRPSVPPPPAETSLPSSDGVTSASTLPPDPRITEVEFRPGRPSAPDSSAVQSAPSITARDIVPAPNGHPLPTSPENARNSAYFRIIEPLSAEKSETKNGAPAAAAPAA
jgi:hypothetical protein